MRGRLNTVGLALCLVGAAACGNATSGKELAAVLAKEEVRDAATVGQAAAEAAPVPSDATSPSGVPSGTGSAVPATGSGSSAGSTTLMASAAGSKALNSSTGGQAAAAARSSAPALPGTAGASPSGGGAPTPGGGASASGQPVPTATGNCNGTSLKIASVGQLSGVLGDVFRPITKGVQAWASQRNAGGGVNCHPVVYLTADDGGDPARHQALVRQMVEKEGIVAFVAMVAPITGRASKDYLNQKKVPVIGSEGAEMFFYESPMHFPTTTSDDFAFQTVALVAGKVTVPEGKTKAATFTCQEIEACNAAEKNFVAAAAQAGYEIVLKGKASLASPDLTSFCIQARNAGAQVILGGMDGASYRRLKRDCAKIDYHPVVALAAAQAQDSYPQAPEMEGSVVVLLTMPWFYDQPAAAEYRAAVKQYVSGEFSQAGGIHGWTAAKAFEAATKRIGPADQPTSAAVLAGLYGLGGNDLGGLTYPLDFKEGQPDPVVKCGWALTVGKGEWTSPVRERLCFS